MCVVEDFFTSFSRVSLGGMSVKSPQDGFLALLPPMDQVLPGPRLTTECLVGWGGNNNKGEVKPGAWYSSDAGSVNKQSFLG